MAQILLLRNFIEDRRTSMEVYADNLYQALIDAEPTHDLRYYRPTTRFSKNNKAGKWPMRIARYIEYPLQVKRLKADLFHVTEHGYAHLVKHLPANRTIVTVHDLIPYLKHRGAIAGVKPQKNPRLAEYSLKHLKFAAHIIAISENTKNDLIEYCGCRADKISVVYYGLPDVEKFKALSKLHARAELGLPDDRHKLILVTGQEFYKNLPTSIKVFNQLYRTSPVKLVHLGRNNNVWQHAKSFAEHPSAIIEIPYLPHEHIPTLYKAVDCVLFPSWYEGFGLPPLEAMACGTPAVTANTASLPEAVGPHTLTAPPADVDALSASVQCVLFDERKRRTLINAGLEHAKKFSWIKTSRQTLDVYQRLLKQITTTF